MLAGLTFALFVPILVASAGCGRSDEARADEGRSASGHLVQASPTFVQANYATPQMPMITVSVPFTTAQSAGNLNVVVVGWNDTTANVASVSDTSGNGYFRAVGPTAQPGAITQSIYYARNIAASGASANVVTVSFSAAAQFADVRVLEYAGIDPVNPLDVVAAGTGSAATSSTPAVSTTNASDLLFAANTVATWTTGAGTGWTSRVITSPDGDIAEDRVVSTAGSYSATAPLGAAGAWVMQMVAFKGMSSTPPTPPTAPTNLAATAAGSSQINLSWTNTSTTQTGVKIERSTDNVTFTQIAVAGATAVSYSDIGLSASTTYFYRARATNASGDSAYSNTASATTQPPPPTAPTNLAATAAGSSQINLSWTNTSTTQTGVKIERSTDNVTFTQITVAGATAVSYSDTGLSASTTYFYRARATNASGDSAYSNTASATTQSPPPAPIAFVQTNYATPQSPVSSVSVPFTAAQSAGDLSVVVVGWNDATAQVVSVTDTKGNPYQLAVGPLSQAGAVSQSIYYAKNIAAAAAGANAVTVSFTAPAQFPDIRVLEYAGIDRVNPVDVAVSAAGSSATSSTPPVSTTNASDLLFAANTVTSLTTGPGAGWTSRVITSPDGDIAEDQVVTAAGSYGSTAPLSGVAAWVMQMVAFKAAPSGPPPPPPTAPTNLAATAASSAQINLSWTNTSTTYFYRVRATNASGDSAYSNTASATTASPPPPPPPPAASANPLISRGLTTASSPGAFNPSTSINDGDYGTFQGTWIVPGTAQPAWVALRVPPGPAKVLLSWVTSANFDWNLVNEPNYGAPGDYTIATSTNSTNGSDGTWTTVQTVTGNLYSDREHAFAMPAAGAWIKMTITAMPNSNGVITQNGGELQISEIDLHDATSGTKDTWLFLGDSITAFWANRSNQPSFAQIIHNNHPSFFPMMINGGHGGWGSGELVQFLPSFLAINPDVRFVALSYGSNDSAGNTANTAPFKSNVQQAITTLLNAGKVPVIPHIPFSCDGQHNNIPLFNQAIDQLVASNPGTLAGPDLYTYFQAHPAELSDCLHPNATGSLSFNRLWAQAMNSLYL